MEAVKKLEERENKTEPIEISLITGQPEGETKHVLEIDLSVYPDEKYIEITKVGNKFHLSMDVLELKIPEEIAYMILKKAISSLSLKDQKKLVEISNLLFLYFLR